jgi:hypothetical protein
VWKANYDLMRERGIRVPLPVQHTSDPEKSRGEVANLELGKDSKGRDALYLTAKFRDAESAKLSRTCDVSLNAVSQFTDGKGNVYNGAITHVALTDYPVLPDLGRWEIAASLDLPAGKAQKKKAPKMNKMLLDTFRHSRDLQLAHLVEHNCITPACAEALKLSLNTEEQLNLALSHDDADGENPDMFNKICKALEKNSTLALANCPEGKSGSQTMADKPNRKNGKPENSLSRATDKKVEEEKRRSQTAAY